MELIYQAVAAVFQIKALLLLMGGTFLGIVVGALPGLSATMGVAIVSPLTYSMDPFYGIITLLGIYFGGIYGGSISAILLGIPGTPASVASTMDGYAMARKRERRNRAGYFNHLLVCRGSTECGRAGAGLLSDRQFRALFRP